MFIPKLDLTFNLKLILRPGEFKTNQWKHRWQNLANRFGYGIKGKPPRE